MDKYTRTRAHAHHRHDEYEHFHHTDDLFVAVVASKEPFQLDARFSLFAFRLYILIR